MSASVAFFARHELRLSWRDFWSMLTAGRAVRKRLVIAALLVVGACMHLVAYGMVARFAGLKTPDTAALTGISVCLILAFSLMLSQAMESVTRAFYARADLDLILSSPAAARAVFTVRMAALALSTTAMALLLASPFINVLVWCGGPRWLAAYGAVAACGGLAAALAIALTVALFRSIGPKRTRLMAQIVAAVIGAAFIIGLQVAAIQSYGTLSRFAVLQSGSLIELAPAGHSLLWWPARAVLGDLPALAAMLASGFGAIGLAVLVFAGGFGHHAVAAASVAPAPARPQAARGFRPLPPMRSLRRKEWLLLVRDPWLVSQSLMQLLYLLPPALMLWKSFAAGGASAVLIVPVLVMAAGQLAGGLAWLAVSGEDAPDLVATAPLPPRAVLRAKIEAVMAAIGLIFAPLVLLLALAAPVAAMIAAWGIAAAAVSAALVQIWFRAQARRSQFRRRQTSSRLATFAEAFSSISWAATAALAAAGSVVAVPAGLIALGVLGLTRLVRPRPV